MAPPEDLCRRNSEILRSAPFGAEFRSIKDSIVCGDTRDARQTVRTTEAKTTSFDDLTWLFKILSISFGFVLIAGEILGSFYTFEHTVKSLVEIICFRVKDLPTKRAQRR